MTGCARIPKMISNVRGVLIILASYIILAEARNGLFDRCEGNRPYGYYCGSNDANATYLPCSQLCQPIDSSFSEACLKLCGAFALEYRDVLLRDTTTSPETEGTYSIQRSMDGEDSQEKINLPVVVLTSTVVVLLVIIVALAGIIVCLTLKEKRKGKSSTTQSVTHVDENNGEKHDLSPSAPNASLATNYGNNSDTEQHRLIEGVGDSTPLHSMHYVSDQYYPNGVNLSPLFETQRRQPVQHGPDIQLEETAASHYQPASPRI